MKPWPTPDQARARLREQAAERGESLAALSRLIGKPPRYLDTWIRDGRPEWLESTDRKRLERYLGLGEAEIGWPDPAPDA
jgi:transposase-like protein